VKKILLLASAVLATACSPTLTLVTPAPPNRIVAANHQDDAMTISEGVAVAVDCYHWTTGACTGVRATTDDPNVARVLPAHIAKLADMYGNEKSAASLAVVGVSPGVTTLRVMLGKSTYNFTVTVVAAGK
jgi:hypothetical protein